MSVFLKQTNLICCLHKILREQRRFAGHSKWANIKHTKMEKDYARAMLFSQFRQRMRTAIVEGGSVKPSDNAKLAQIIELARKSNMPVASINTFLSKMDPSKMQTHSAIFCIRGAGGWIILVHVTTDNVTRTRNLLSSCLKKYNAKILETIPKGVFDHKGVIKSTKNIDLNSAMDDALEIEAQDVEEINDDDGKYFQFICDPPLLPKVTTKLKSLQYSIISSEEWYIPNVVTEVTEADMEHIHELCDKILKLDEVTKLEDNIA